MERGCGDFQRSLRSKSAPWSNLDKCVLHTAYLDQLESRFDLGDELSEVGKRPKGTLSRSETVMEGYNDFILRTPRKRVHRPDDNTLRMIIDYLREIVPASRKAIKARLPENMPLWGKFRMAHCGDSIRSTMASSKKRVERNMSFVRFELIVFNRPKVLYGRVEKVIQCQLPDDPATFGDFSGKLRLFAYITPCKTDGKDASQELTFYHTETAPIITDLTTIRAVVGRVQTTGGMTNRKQWGIIDRSTALVRTAFGHEDLSDADDDDDDE